MRKATLTSSEVSVLASMTIVVLCTLALFLSGYVIQQRTLRDLRQAIRPRESRPSPRTHLLDRFRTTTTELADGRVVEAESEAAREAQQMADAVAAAGSTRPEEERQSGDGGDGDDAEASVSDGQRALLAQLRAQVEAQAWAVEHPDPRARGRVVTAAERRRLIKEEIQRLAQSERPVYYQRRLW